MTQLNFSLILQLGTFFSHIFFSKYQNGRGHRLDIRPDSFRFRDWILIDHKISRDRNPTKIWFSWNIPAVLSFVGCDRGIEWANCTIWIQSRYSNFRVLLLCTCFPRKKNSGEIISFKSNYRSWPNCLWIQSVIYHISQTQEHFKRNALSASMKVLLRGIAIYALSKFKHVGAI